MKQPANLAEFIVQERIYMIPEQLRKDIDKYLIQELSTKRDTIVMIDGYSEKVDNKTYNGPIIPRNLALNVVQYLWANDLDASTNINDIPYYIYVQFITDVTKVREISNFYV